MMSRKGWGQFRPSPLTIGILLVLSAVRVVSAANGDVVHETTFSTPCPVGSFPVGSLGLGIAFDGKFLWYSCAGTGSAPDLFKADPITGNTVGSFNVAGGLGPL